MEKDEMRCEDKRKTSVYTDIYGHLKRICNKAGRLLCRSCSFKKNAYLILALNSHETKLMVVKRTRYAYLAQHSQTLIELSWEHELERFTQQLQTVITDHPCHCVLLSVPSECIESQRRPLANTPSTAEIVEMAYLEFEQLYPNSHEYYFDFDLVKNDNELIFISLLKQRVEKLLTVLSALNLHVICITADCTAERLAQEGLRAFY